jgi:hypothetical protein
LESPHDRFGVEQLGERRIPRRIVDGIGPVTVPAADDENLA